MNFFAGLEKFGFSGKEDLDITKDERKVARTAGDEKKAVVELEEKDLILEKTIAESLLRASVSDPDQTG